MSPEKRIALLRVLSEWGDTEFWTDSLEEPVSSFFIDHANVFEGYLAALNGLNPSKDMDPISFLYLNRTELNACAFRTNGYRFIAFNWGAVIIVHDLFFRMLSSPHVLPHVGDPSVEISIASHPRIPLDASDLFDSSEDPFGLSITPQDPVRAIYACYLARTALDFLFIHEHQHAAGGHHLVMEGAAITEIAEFQKEPWKIDLMTRHVLECEADAAAANFTLGLARDRKGNAWRRPEAIRSLLNTDHECTHAWLFAVFTLFVIMEEGSQRMKHRGTHPSPVAMRAFLMMSVLGLRGPFASADEAFKYGDEVFGQVDQAISAIAERPDGKRFTIAHIGSNREEHMNLLKKRWFELQPRLRSLAKRSGVVCAPKKLVEFFCTA